MDGDMEILTRAASLLENRFGRIAASTAREYADVADRLAEERLALGTDWRGPAATAASRGSASVRRAAWSRRSHLEVAASLRDLRGRLVPVEDSMARLRAWVPEAEACIPAPPRTEGSLNRGRPRAVAGTPTRSKRVALRDLPERWMDTVWDEAVDRPSRHLSAIAVLTVTGCRPAEACLGVGLRLTAAGLDIAVAGVKTRAASGQPWRLLSVADDGGGPASHLIALAAAGAVRVRAGCTANALSMAISDLAEACLPGRRISAYDFRHQRAADARTAFGGDVAMVAA